MRRIIAVLAIVVGLSLATSGCSLLSLAPSASQTQASDADQQAREDAALEAYVAAVKVALKKQDNASWRATYSKMTVRSGGSGSGTIEYQYTYATKVDKAAAKKYLETQLATLQGGCDSSVFPEMKTAGISEPKVRYSYFNKNGSKIWSHLFTPSTSG